MRIATIAGTATAVAGLALILTAGSATPPTPPAAAAAPPDFVHDQAANFAADAVSEDLAPTLEKSPGFVGQRVTADGLEVDVSGMPTGAENRLVANEAGGEKATLVRFGFDRSTLRVPIAFRSVPYSLATLIEVTRRLDADSGSLAASGIPLASWGPDIDTDTVVVHLADYTDAAAYRLKARYGATIRVAAGNESLSAATRTADAAAWWGGDAITSGTALCTSWFSVLSASGTPISPTAGHCGAGAWRQNGHAFGTVTSRHFGGAMDGELIPVSSNAANVWSDPHSVSRTVTALATGNTVGVLTCTDGYVDRETCSVRIDSTGQSVTYGGQTITGLVGAHQTAGLPAFSAGDSGGPVETTSGSAQSIAQGMLLATVDGTNSSQGWYMPARTVDSYFDVFVRTS